jgi:hypothetical protein
MMRFRALSLVAVGVLVLGLASVAVGMKEQAKPMLPPANAVGGMSVAEPFLMLQAGDTTWIQVHASTSRCPGDPLGGHGGEGTGGPDGSETYCVEQGVGDSCGTVSPWTNACFKYLDVRSLPSQTGVNYWHVDSYRTDQRDYTGDRALWCGSASTWGNPPVPVECGTWINPPGYGSQWNCVVQLSLPAAFSVATGCTLYFDPRYDTECKYDYFYVDYLSVGPSPTFLQTWVTKATFNATSSNPGAICGTSPTGNPDFWGNSDIDRALNCDWQDRTTGYPAFKGIITAANFGTLTSAPKFRWRFVSDGAWDDMDGRGNTDGGAFLDNVQVYGSAGSSYTQNFEGCAVFGALPEYWSLPNPAGVISQWHIVHDPDAPYEGGDGGTRTTCLLDSSWVWRGRPENGYPSGVAWRNGWFYRLLTPRIAIQQTGAVCQYDQFMCALDYTCDYTDTKVRFYDGGTDTWCPWINMDDYILYGGCFFWNFDDWDDLTAFYGSDAESLQMGWDLMDNSSVGDVCRGKHKDTDNIVDNVSIGFFDGNATIFSARGIDILQDSFLEEVNQAYNSFFDAYSTDSILKYSGATPPPLPKADQLYIECTDKDDLAYVKIYGSIDGGATWKNVSMTLNVPADPGHLALGGEYYGTLKASTFVPGDSAWKLATECWYYVEAKDLLNNLGYFPARANPSHPDHDGTANDYFGFSIMPMFKAGAPNPKILLVDGHNRNLYDWSPCLTVLDDRMPLEDIYEQTLIDAGYCYDKFDISGAGSNQHVHPLQYTDYDAVVWFTGPYFSNYLFDKEAQIAIKNYLANEGKFVLCGDRIAYNMAVVGEDSLGGEFLTGIMGCEYQEEMEGGFAKPFVYLEAPATVTVGGTPVSIPLDTIPIYRECPYLKDMSYVQANPTPWSGYYAQKLLDVTNNGTTYPNSDGAIYVETSGGGQCVYVNFDLCATINHERALCSGTTPAPAPDFAPGNYYGRVELMKVILGTLFGLPSTGGKGGVAGVPTERFQWALGQNFPNPLSVGTQIKFEVAKTSDVSIKVYNAMGQLVKVLKEGKTEPGRYSVSWDGRNQAGEGVSSGVYFYKMEGEKFAATSKMLVVK